jgi:pimeloyl-ACP methyl ester carboxylesterase
MPSTPRFLASFLVGRGTPVVAQETTYRRDGDVLPATLYRPRTVHGPLPAWMTLHGLTFHGRHHLSLQRFARALAASGSVVLVPDLPEWRALRIAPATAVRTIQAAVLELDRHGLSRPGRVGVVGFSFGATQALIAATRPELQGHLAGVAAWGGYAHLEALTRFTFFGEHDLDGRTYRRDPDPYGRWILAGNYLGLLPEHARDRALPDALLGLALEAGRRTIMSWDPRLDPLKREVRQRLDPEAREVFDLIAPPVGTTLDEEGRERLELLLGRLLELVAVQEPLLDPAPYLGRVPVPVFLAHGRDDRLIPWTEMIRLRRALPPGRVAASGLTGLFAHSGGRRAFPTPGTVREAARFVALLRRMLRLI